MIRGVISAAGLAAEFAVYQSHGYIAGFLTATAVIAAMIEIMSGSAMRELAERLIGGDLPHSVEDQAFEESQVAS